MQPNLASDRAPGTHHHTPRPGGHRPGCVARHPVVSNCHRGTGCSSDRFTYNLVQLPRDDEVLAPSKRELSLIDSRLHSTPGHGGEDAGLRPPAQSHRVFAAGWPQQVFCPGCPRSGAGHARPGHHRSWGHVWRHRFLQGVQKRRSQADHRDGGLCSSHLPPRPHPGERHSLPPDPAGTGPNRIPEPSPISKQSPA